MPDHNRTTDRPHCIPGLNGRRSSGRGSRTNPPETGVSPVNDRHHRLPRPGVTPHDVPHKEEQVFQLINMRLLKLLLSRQHPGDKVLINTQVLADAPSPQVSTEHPGVDPFIAPEKTRHGRVLEPEPRDRIPEGLSARDRMRRKLRTKRGRARYALRMETVEPVFGQIKQGRGFRQFLLRGLAKANREWLLICAGHNLLKLFLFGPGMSGNVRGQRRQWEQPGIVRGHGQWDFQATIRRCLTAPCKNCCRR